MFRKTLVALAATTAIAVASLAPTASFAHPGGFGGPHFGHFGHFGHFRHFGVGFYGPGYVDDGDCYYVRKWTPWGYRLVAVCG